jgi:polysaccharide export outer membrane protein
MPKPFDISAIVLFGVVAAALTGCGSMNGSAQLPPAPTVAAREGPGEDYMIGPLDQLTVFVWRNPELGAKVQVRPDGRITTPLITDMPAVGKTPTMLARDIKLQLSQYINEPIVSVMVNEFAGTTSQ